MRFLLLIVPLAACTATIEPDPPHVEKANARAMALSHRHTIIATDLFIDQLGDVIPQPLDTNGDPLPLHVPVADAVVVGRAHACVLSAAGSVHCWGDHSRGALGTHRTCIPPETMGGAPDCTLGAEIMPTLPPARAIAAGDDVTCAIVEDGDRVVCWGVESRLGGSHLPPLDPPTPVMAGGQPLAAARIVIGGGSVCAITFDGALWCWGDSFGTTPVRQPQTGVVDIAIGHTHTCIIDSTGLACWGDDHNGQTGDLELAHACGTSAGSCRNDQPVHVAVSSPVHVVVGERHSCALQGNGDVSCWGSNEVGQLGRNDAFLAGDLEFALDGALDLASGFSHTCALRRDSSVWCWGTTTVYEPTETQ